MKKTEKINEKRIAAYTAAASAALMAASPANAAIQYSSQDITVNYGSSVAIDIDGNATTDIVAGLFGSELSNKYAALWGGSFAGPSNYSSYYASSFVSTTTSFLDVSNFGNSDFIDSNLDWFDTAYVVNPTYYSQYDQGFLFGANASGSDIWGNFHDNAVGPDSGFIGIRFSVDAPMAADDEIVPIGSQDYYGWVHIDSVPSNGESYHIDGWAYEDSGAGITAGATPIVPEPSSIALFAAGASAMLAWRRRKNRR